jgi:hypothetical protein
MSTTIPDPLYTTKSGTTYDLSRIVAVSGIKEIGCEVMCVIQYDAGAQTKIMGLVHEKEEMEAARESLVLHWGSYIVQREAWRKA